MNARLEISIRPQPVGLTPWPHGGLLLPDVEGAARAAREVVVDGADDATIPPTLAFWSAARDDDVPGALEVLAKDSLENGDSPIAAYNRFVLDPSASKLDELRSRFAGEPLGAMLEVAARHAGLEAQAIDADLLDGELLALAIATDGAISLERGASDSAVESFVAAASVARDASPGFAAQLMLSAFEIEREAGAATFDRARARMQEALDVLPESGFPVIRAEIQLELGALLQQEAPQDKRRLLDAAAHYQDALRNLDPDRHRRAHGFAQMRLGLVYLSLPMREAGDALRMGVATQALREAVRTLSPEIEPDLWCAAATNLANAYQILPSGHLAENLDEAIALYGRVLELRAESDDPAGHARARINRANASASLERLSEAIDDLVLAIPLLQRCGLAEDAGRARGMLDDLRRRVTGIQGEQAS